MKKLYIILILTLIFSCTPDDYKLFDNSVEKKEIKIIELRADSDRLIADNEALMNFRIMAYGIREIKDLYKEEVNDTIHYKDSLRLDTFLISEDQYPKNLFKVYDSKGNVIENNQFKTADSNVKTIGFIAKSDILQSNVIDIKIRKKPEENYEEIVFPIIFHVLAPPEHSVPAMKVTPQIMQGKLDLINKIYNRERTTNPNGGNAKVTFKLAKFDKNGVLLKQEGLNIVKVKKKLSVKENLAFMKKHLIWNPNKYINIWIADIADGWSQTGSNSFKSVPPTVILEGEESIKGIKAEPVTEFVVTEETEITDVGIVYDRGEFLKASGLSENRFELSTIIGRYFGLLPMELEKKWVFVPGKGWEKLPQIVDGDNDYCDDTPVYDYAYSLYKKNYITGQYFTTFNIMANYSRKNSITVDQANRIREVVKKCPSRWAYKSNWAFTGK